MRRNVTRNVILGTFALVLVLHAQEAPNPTCNRCSASYIPKEEIQAYLNRLAPDVRVSDQQIRAVDVGKSNVDIGIVYRGKTTGGTVAEHDFVSEVYYVIDGSGTLVTGHDIVGWKRRPSTNENVRMLNGPGGDGTSIRNAATHQLKAGDVIIIPAGVGHQFTQIDDHIRYLMVRVDPDKVTPLKDEAASQADLKKGK
ncbi:MAG: AraC family ligand binding domain-containing protein [Acidobacteria bacterium]|nr:AraC family ligand binding domain-containing protein [Acidobacteriota bacterium]